MKKIWLTVSLIISAALMVLGAACQSKNINPVSSSSGSLGSVRAKSITSSPCFFSDDFMDPGTIADYDFFAAGTQLPSTAAAEGYSIGGGILQCTGGITSGGLAVVDNAFFSHSISDYTIDGDFEMDSTAGGLGVFGIAFRTGDNGSFYCFQMNENPSNADGGIPNWQVEKNTGAPSVNFSYPGCCVSNPGYTFGTFVHLQVVAQGNHFQCFLNGGKLYDFIDPTPFTNGGVGVRTYGIQDGNVVRIKNFVVNACPPSTPTATATPTDTPTDTPTATPTSTPTATPTATSILPPPALTHMPTPALTHIPPKLR